MKRIVLMILASSLFLTYCGGEKIKNPHIDKTFISYEYHITSSRAGGRITPSFSVTFHRTTQRAIRKLKFMLTYYYGQTFQFTYRKNYVWTGGDANLAEMNKAGQTELRLTLGEMKREGPEVITSEETYTKPDGEVLEVVLWELEL
jgi:hypothetical protein